MNKEGVRFAQLFRQARGLREVRQCDLEAITAEDEIEITDFDDPDPGCTACLFPRPDKSGGLILLASGQHEGRRRFSISHELAHYHIPTHTRKRRRCAEADLQATDGYRPPAEWEANSFAAELLMPRLLFSKDARDRDISFQTLYELMAADMYNVSATAAALRLVETTRETCALIAVRDGCVEWQQRLDFFFRMATRGQRIGPDTIAGSVCRGEASNARPEAVSPAAWLDEPQGARFKLLESTHEIPRLGQVLSLLWVPDLDA